MGKILRKFSICLACLLLLLQVHLSECDERKNEKGENKYKGRPRVPRVSPLTVIKGVGTVASAVSKIYKMVCQVGDICGSDEISLKLEAMEEELDKIQENIESIADDVSDIWEEVISKWYFDHIKYINQQREYVSADIKADDNSEHAKERRQRFIYEVLGGQGTDEYVYKALFHISRVVFEDDIVQRYFKKQKELYPLDTAITLTWTFIRNLFQIQEDGYASMIFAYVLKYKDDEASYNKSMSEVCAFWKKLRDTDYIEFCAQFEPSSREDRRKMQQEHLYPMRDLYTHPIFRLAQDCNTFQDSYSLHFAGNNLFVVKPNERKITIADRILNVVKDLSIGENVCDGNCYPYGITISVEYKVLAMAAKGDNKKSYVLFYHINGDFNEPSQLTITYYDKMLQLVGGTNPDVRIVAFCGERFAYAEYSGQIFNYYMLWGNTNPMPNVFDRYDWYLNRDSASPPGTEFIDCSISGDKWLIERLETSSSYKCAGGVPSWAYSSSESQVLETIADITVSRDNWSWVGDWKSRLDNVKGTAMDSKGNFYYSASQKYSNGVSGIYALTYDHKNRFILEWNSRALDKKIDMFDLTVSDDYYLYQIQKDGNAKKCIHMYDPRRDYEDIIV